MAPAFEKMQTHGLFSMCSSAERGREAVAAVPGGKEITVGSHFATLRFTTIHFYDPCRVGPSTPDLWCITVANQASFLYLRDLINIFSIICIIFYITNSLN